MHAIIRSVRQNSEKKLVESVEHTTRAVAESEIRLFKNAQTSVNCQQLTAFRLHQIHGTDVASCTRRTSGRGLCVCVLDTAGHDRQPTKRLDQLTCRWGGGRRNPTGPKNHVIGGGQIGVTW